MKQKIAVGLAVLGLAMLCMMGALFVLGQPVDAGQLAYHVTEHNTTVEVQVSALESAVALRGWRMRQEGGDLFLSARKVPVSALFSSGEYRTSIATEGIERIYLGGRLIWQSGESAGSQTKIKPENE